MSRMYDLYSKRAKPNNDPINYNPLDKGLKIQIWYIIDDFFEGLTYAYLSSAQTFHYECLQIWSSIYKIICREHKLENIVTGINFGTTDRKKIGWHFKTLSNINQELDIVEIIAKAIDKIVPLFTVDFKSAYSKSDAISDINTRFQESGSGFRFLNGEIVKIPSEFTYSQAIQPSLLLTNDTLFKNAQDEFLSAFEHYKLNKYEEALTDCLKSVESTIKIICKSKKWAYNETDTARALIKIIIDNGLVPTYSESFLNGIRNVLEGTVPTLRNKLGGHGKGAIDRKVDEASMSFSINMTASIILYLIQRFRGN